MTLAGQLQQYRENLSDVYMDINESWYEDVANAAPENAMDVTAKVSN